MATMTEPVPKKKAIREAPYHDYHAEAHVLSGDLQRPIEQKIEAVSHISLHDRRGGHFTRFNEVTSVEGLISFAKGKTRVSGSRSKKHGGWVTTSASIMEGLNSFEVITADRVISQVSTDHSLNDGHYARVTFLGSQFNNLRVSGFEVPLTFNFGICGNRPSDDRSYLRDLTFLEGIKRQTEKIAKAEDLPQGLKDSYYERLENVNRLIAISRAGKWDNDEPRIVCSLVESIGEIPIPGVRSYGHVLVIPEFGSVSLGEIVVGEKNHKADPDDPDPTPPKPSVYFQLTGISMEMGCVAHGSAVVGSATANGTHKP
ncbi:MAG TPA: hypothetical protein VMP68_16515 [Candidatus Eisenbacteria bacterium]|nr:hypothetical protein [Candidatus Eisenbacteria bacterium]